MTIVILAGANTALDVQNTTNAASNQVAVFRAGNRTPGQANDEGYFSFYADDSAGNPAEFARMSWIVKTATSTAKDGGISFDVQKNNTLTRVLETRHTGTFCFAPSASNLALAARAAASQSANIQEWQKSDATVRRYIGPNGEDGMMADATTDTTPSNTAAIKKITLQRRDSAPANAAYIKFTNSPGEPGHEFYLVMENG